jgi:hypothetical protein
MTLQGTHTMRGDTTVTATALRPPGRPGRLAGAVLAAVAATTMATMSAGSAAAAPPEPPPCETIDGQPPDSGAGCLIPRKAGKPPLPANAQPDPALTGPREIGGSCPPFACGTDGNHNEVMASST